ncbi:MAG: hypothetical protein R2760_01710 [Chitinophagales bacterium]
MDIQTRKIKFVQTFLKLQSEDVISKLEKILKKNQVDEIIEDLKPLTIKELNRRISQSEKDFENGEFKTTSPPSKGVITFCLNLPNFLCLFLLLSCNSNP